MKFFVKDMFYLLALVLFSALLYLRLHKKNRRKMKKLGDVDMIARMIRSVSNKKRYIKIALKLSAMALIVVAMARPKAGLTTETVTKKGIDVIIVLDVSKSMLATDSAPNRFERAKLEMLSLIDRLDDDRIGLVLFSGTAFMQMPLTNDYSAARLFVKNVAIDTLPQPGTAGSAAINICLDVFKRESKRARAIVMFSDGEFHDEELIKSVQKAKEAGVVITTVGLGTESGGPIPLKQTGGITSFKKDKDGDVVLSKMNRKKLKNITETTGGTYLTTQMPDMIGRIIKNFDKLEKISIEETLFTQLEEQFELPLILAGLMLLIESLVTERRRYDATK